MAGVVPLQLAQVTEKSRIMRQTPEFGIRLTTSSSLICYLVLVGFVPTYVKHSAAPKYLCALQVDKHR